MRQILRERAVCHDEYINFSYIPLDRILQSSFLNSVLRIFCIIYLLSNTRDYCLKLISYMLFLFVS